MDLTLLLRWFPIVLAVGIGGRLLGRPGSVFLGFVCALFCVVLVQASMGYAIRRNPWTVEALLCGYVAIPAMGAWSGDTPVERAIAGALSAETSTGASAVPHARDAKREAISQCHRAHRHGTAMASDLDRTPVAVADTV